MAIAFSCPHCKKKYKLADNMAGRRVTCADAKCRKQFVVPTPVPTAQPASHVNAEEYAAAALSEPAAPVEAKKEPEAAPIKVKCPHCDFQNTFEARMAGKNAPCQNDECRKVIKVPLLEKEGAKDWRKMGKPAPSLARIDTAPGMEGAWGVVQQTAVSREALKEAEAIGGPEEEEGPNWRKRIIRIVVAVTVLGLIAYGIFYGVRRWNRGQERRTMDLALKAANNPEESKLKPEQAGLIFLLAAEHSEHQQRWTDAYSQLREAAGRLKGNSLSPDRSLAIINVSVDLADLIGTKEELDAGQRLGWQKEKLDDALRQTLQQLQQGTSEDIRDLHSIAFAKLVRKMSARGQFEGCVRLASQTCSDDHRSEVLAVMGLEMLRLGQRNRAEELAMQADGGNKAQAPSLIALWLAIGSPDSPEKAKEGLAHAKAIAPEPAKNESFTPVQRIGWAAGWARQDKLDKARELLSDKSGSPEERFRAKAAVAEVVVAAQPSDTTELQACAEQLAKDFKNQPAPMWVLWRLVHVSLKAGKPDFAKYFAEAIGDPSLRAEAQLAMLRAELDAAAAKKETVSESRALDVGDPDGMAQAMACMEIARHNTRISSASKVMKDVGGWSSKLEKWKPFAY
ncbi:MAG TPA: hypothetical protein VGZ47_21215, partial [Gemmataceae bacterium]|nr:hypothetical protein [Gemmataceae bacterium]